MGTYTNIKQYRAVWNKRAKAIHKAADKSSSQAATYMVLKAKAYAPKYTGATMSGIRRRKRKNGEWTVESWVPGPFKQNMWANQTPPFAAPRMVWNGKRPTIYGDGSHHTTSVRIPFFTVAGLETAKKFKQIAFVNTDKALRATV
jgi:hypothetical protein